MQIPHYYYEYKGTCKYYISIWKARVLVNTTLVQGIQGYLQLLQSNSAQQHCIRAAEEHSGSATQQHSLKHNSTGVQQHLMRAA